MRSGFFDLGNQRKETGDVIQIFSNIADQRGGGNGRVEKKGECLGEACAKKEGKGTREGCLEHVFRSRNRRRFQRGERSSSLKRNFTTGWGKKDQRIESDNYGRESRPAARRGRGDGIKRLGQQKLTWGKRKRGKKRTSTTYKYGRRGE